ncbi:MAG: hypothetical protein K9J83_05615 [Desulfarculaceae bacterium]|nr:hypothetical protein [Desulfarculaceae bacterium]
MIKPIFFPFAHITQMEMDMISRFFEPFVYLPTLREKRGDPVIEEAVDQARLNRHFASSRELEEVERQAEGYREIARLNRDGKTGLREFLRMGPFLKSDTSVGGIRSEIEKGAKPSGGNGDPAGDVNRDLLLLYLSGIFDREKRAVESEFQSVRKAELRLFEAMRGEQGQKNFPAAGDFRLEDLGACMTGERVESWARYSARTLPDLEPGVLPVYVTTSPSVFAYMISSAESAINILDMEHFRVHEEECENQHQWKKEWEGFIRRLLESDDEAQSASPGPADDGCRRTATFRLSLLWGGDAVHMFRHAGESLPVCLIEK